MMSDCVFVEGIGIRQLSIFLHEITCTYDFAGFRRTSRRNLSLLRQIDPEWACRKKFVPFRKQNLMTSVRKPLQGQQQFFDPVHFTKESNCMINIIEALIDQKKVCSVPLTTFFDSFS